MSSVQLRVLGAIHASGVSASPREIASLISEPVEVVFGALVELEADGLAYISKEGLADRGFKVRERLWAIPKSILSAN